MIKIKTDLIHFGYINKNGRIYKEENIDLSELNFQTYFLGEINNPDRFEIDLSKVSHKIDNFVIQGGILYGDIETLHTPSGVVLDQYIEDKIVVFRPRATGILANDGTIKEYKIHTFDAISIWEDSFEMSRLRKSKLEKIILKIKHNS